MERLMAAVAMDTTREVDELMTGNPRWYLYTAYAAIGLIAAPERGIA